MIDQAEVEKFADAVSAAFRRSTAPPLRASAAPRRPARRSARIHAEARPGRSCALIITEEDGSVGEAILDAATCREMSAVLTRAAR